MNNKKTEEKQSVKKLKENIKIRLAKKIAESGIASRREAERMISEGRVKVNGEVITTPVFFVDDSNIILIDEKPISEKTPEIVMWKFYKPTGVITSRVDNKGRPTVFDYFKGIKERLIYVGRLDCNSEGLLLFVNNGDLARKMELPKTGMSRTYKARIYGNLSTEAKEQMKKGVTIKGIKYGSVKIEDEEFLKLKSEKKSKNNWITITLSEGKNREIRKLMEYFNCKVSRLIRIHYGPFKLEKMRPGEIKRVNSKEIEAFLKEISK